MKKLLLFFYNSRLHKLVLGFNAFFKNSILKNADKSLIVNSFKKLAFKISLKDTGLFIVLVVVFNTLAMFALGKQIDIFSLSARIFFFVLGIALFFKRK